MINFSLMAPCLAAPSHRAASGAGAAVDLAVGTHPGRRQHERRGSTPTEQHAAGDPGRVMDGGALHDGQQDTAGRRGTQARRAGQLGVSGSQVKSTVTFAPLPAFAAAHASGHSTTLPSCR